MQQLIMNDSVRSSNKVKLDESIVSKSSKSMINFDGEDDISKMERTENLFNTLVKNNIILEFHEVNGFLLSLGMEKYFDQFIQNGFDSIEKIKSIINSN